MKRLLMIITLPILVNSCKSAINEGAIPEYYARDLYFQIDEKFVAEIMPKLYESHSKFIAEEKQSFLAKGLKDDNYLQSINSEHDYLEINGNRDRIIEQIKSIIKLREKHLNIEQLYLFSVCYSGEQFLRYEFAIVEDRSGMEIYYFRTERPHDGVSKLIEKKSLYKEYPGVTEAFVDNLRYSYEDVKKIDFSAGFIVYKIAANGANNYTVKTHIIHDLLATHNVIFEKIYEIKK